MPSERYGACCFLLDRTPFLCVIFPLCLLAVLPMAALGSGERDSATEQVGRIELKDPALPLSFGWSLDWAIGDFDGDRRPDLASTELVRPGTGVGKYTVQISLSSRWASSSFEVDTPPNGGLFIKARDIDGDRDLDLVITSGLLHRRVGIWKNDGNGSFTEADPSLYPEQVWRDLPAVSSPETQAYDRNAVLNGSHLSLSLSGRSAVDPAVSRFRLSIAQCWNGRLYLLSGPLLVRPPPRA